MKKEWFFDKFCGEQLVVYAEDGKIVEVGWESNDDDAIGNVYKGRVANIVAGINAAFISCGMEKNCYLPLDEGAAVFSTYDGEAVREQLSLKEGDEILVQLVKPARGNKGAKVTCDLSFVGKNLIFLPKTDFLGISRKITDPDTRDRLLKEAAKFREAGQGLIVRTAAQEATKRQLKTESEYLKRVYRAALEQARSAPVGAVVYREYELPVKVMRDSLGGGVSRIYVGDRELYEKVLGLVRLRGDFHEKNVVFHEGDGTLFADYGLTSQIYALVRRNVELENGGNLVIDRTEAMTIIDVNTGKYTGESDLESTVFETNLIAAKEIARQVRLRNIGGIVAVDFIDMTEDEHRRAVDEALTCALMQDKAKCRVLPMSELCVTLFTRKRTSREIGTLMLKPCPHCTRQGFVYSDLFMAMQLRNAITEKFKEGYCAVIVELNRELMNTILSKRYLTDEADGRWRGKRVYMIPHSTWHEETFTARGENGDDGVLTLPDEAQLLY